jgi:hypothetical protein
MAAFVLASVAFSHAESLVDFGRLFQCITLTAGWGWLTLLAVYLLRTHRQSSAKMPSSSSA